MDQFSKELLDEYLLDSNEQIEIIENTVVNLEKQLSSSEIDLLFRAYHTLKGNSALVGEVKIRDLSHVAENMISEVRNGNEVVSETMASLILSSTDLIRTMLKELEGPNRTIKTDPSIMVEEIKSFITSQKENREKHLAKQGQTENRTNKEPKRMKVKWHPKLTIFELPGSLDKKHINDFLAAIRLFQQRGTVNYIFRFDKTVSLADGGLELIWRALKEVETGNGRLVNCGISPDLIAIIKKEKLDEMMEIEPSIKDAAAVLSLF